MKKIISVSAILIGLIMLVDSRIFADSLTESDRRAAIKSPQIPPSASDLNLAQSVIEFASRELKRKELISPGIDIGITAAGDEGIVFVKIKGEAIASSDVDKITSLIERVDGVKEVRIAIDPEALRRGRNMRSPEEQRINLALTNLIKEALANDLELQSKQIDIKAFADRGGAYLLIEEEHTPEDLERILSIVFSVPGVRSIDAVLPSLSTPRNKEVDDVTLEDRIRSALKDDEVLQTKHIKTNISVIQNSVSVEMRKSELSEVKRVEIILRSIEGIKDVCIRIDLRG